MKMCCPNCRRDDRLIEYVPGAHQCHSCWFAFILYGDEDCEAMTARLHAAWAENGYVPNYARDQNKSSLN